MSFVTDEMVRAARMAVASKLYAAGAMCFTGPPGHWAACGAEACACAAALDAGVRAGLEAAAPIWLAHVQTASEHTADYQMAAAAAELRRLATTPPVGPADTGETM